MEIYLNEPRDEASHPSVGYTGRAMYAQVGFDFILIIKRMSLVSRDRDKRNTIQ